MRVLNKLTFIASMLVAAVLFISSVSSAATLTVKTKDGTGSYLADERGMALYLFKKDTPDKSACGAANGCLEKWPVFRADAVDPGAGIDPAAVGTLTRDDGAAQTTYKGQPLYYFFKDTESGATNGQGVNNVWYLVTP